MVKKPKTVAFRVTEEEYEAMCARLAWCKLSEQDELKQVKTVAHLVEFLLKYDMNVMVTSLRKQKKNAEAAAKRKATRDAKKAVND